MADVGGDLYELDAYRTAPGGLPALVTRCGDDVAAIAADGRTLVAQQGVERFRLEDVGERAGDSRAAPAKYYRDKAGLLSPPFFTSSVC